LKKQGQGDKVRQYGMDSHIARERWR